MNIRYRVELSQAERDELTAMLSKGKCAARKLKRAQILLAADAVRCDEEIARTVAVGGSTVYRTKRRLVEGNLERALSEEPRPGAERKLTGKEEALLVAPLAPGRLRAEPAGRWSCWLARWSNSPITRACPARRHAGGWTRKTSSRDAGTCGASPGSMANMSPAWKTCSTSMPKRPIPSGRWCASTRARSSSSARCASPSRPSRASSNATIASIAATALLTSLSASHPPALAQRQGHRAARRRGLRPMHARARRCPLSRCRVHLRRAGQSVDPLGRRPLPGLRARRSSPHLAAPAVPLRPQARQLAQHGRNRDRCPARPVPGPQDRRLEPPRCRNRHIAPRRMRTHQIDVGQAIAHARIADRSTVRGPLHGVPLAIKDVIYTVDMPRPTARISIEDIGPQAMRRASHSLGPPARSFLVRQSRRSSR